MVVAMGFFTFGDLAVKLTAQNGVPIGQIVTILGVGMAIFFRLIMVREGQPVYHKKYLIRPVFLRCAGEIIATFGIIYAIALAPLSTVSALLQSLPLLLTLMGAMFLGERVGIHRILALLAGLIGVLIIIRPGLAGFDVYASLTLVGVVGMAMRDFATRITPSAITTASLSYHSSVTLAVAGLFYMMATEGAVMPGGKALFFAFTMVLLAAFGTFTISVAMRLGDISVISPFRFVRIVFGAAAGIVILGETIDTPTIIGSMIVVAAGLYSWLRERRLALQAND